ncbi:hypothetical protein AMECASPLE_028934 [Ameca splendens]|uniref:Uncharacterized protein n=1 Tax=Ameca splendens TaxID=208324 RepID=A0ABV0ZSM6_9TELE
MGKNKMPPNTSTSMKSESTERKEGWIRRRMTELHGVLTLADILTQIVTTTFLSSLAPQALSHCFSPFAVDPQGKSLPYASSLFLSLFPPLFGPLGLPFPVLFPSPCYFSSPSLRYTFPPPFSTPWSSTLAVRRVSNEVLVCPRQCKQGRISLSPMHAFCSVCL